LSTPHFWHLAIVTLLQDFLYLKLPAHRAGLPGKVISFCIVPLDPACKAGLTGHLPVKTKNFEKKPKELGHSVRREEEAKSNMGFQKRISNQLRFLVFPKSEKNGQASFYDQISSGDYRFPPFFCQDKFHFIS
jgi:hypothetical protein